MPETTSHVQEVKLDSITPRSVHQMNDTTLLDAHRVLHRAWANFLAGQNYNHEDLVNAHLAVYQEMLARGMNHSNITTLDTETEQLLHDSQATHPTSRKPIYHDLADFVWIEDFLSLSGSAINYPDEPHDLDLIIRGALDLTDPHHPFLKLPFIPLRIKLERLLPADDRPRLHYVDEPTGPNWTYQPLFRLVLQPIAPMVHTIPDHFQFHSATLGAARALEAITPMHPFTPMKATAAYHVGEYFDTAELYNLWAKPFLEADRPIAVQEKFDGIRLLVHKQGSHVAIYTEDKKQDRADFLPHVADAIRKLSPNSLILDTEFVIWQDGSPIPRHLMIGLVTSKTPYTTTTDIRVNIHDCLYLDGQDLTTQTYSKRLEALNEALPKVTPPLYPAATHTATDKISLDKAIAWASQEPGSEGAMLKTMDSPYEVTGAAPTSELWAKFKLVKELKVQVIGTYTKPLPWQAADLQPSITPLIGQAAIDAFHKLTADSHSFLYRCAYLDADTLTPLHAKGTIGPADLSLRWTVKGQKDPITGQLASFSQWRGQSDPRLWAMAKPFPQETSATVPYAVTYATAIEAKLGDILTVQPVRLDSFIGNDGHTHYSWTFPIVREQDPNRDKPDTLQDLQRLARTTHAMEATLDPETIALLPKRERQRIELEKAIGDWYMVEQPDSGPLHFVVQHHIRGIWDDATRIQLHSALTTTDQTQATRDTLWHEHDLATLTSINAIRAAAQHADDAREDVSAAIAAHLDSTPSRLPPTTALLTQLVNLANVHTDWRFMLPSHDALFGWTLDVPKAVLQFLDGHILYLIRNHFLANHDDDNILAQKKAMQPTAWFTLVTKAKPTYKAEPATVGATAETAGLFTFQDSGQYLLLTQKSDYHEYACKFTNHPHLNGRWGFQLLPPKAGYEKAPPYPWWMLNRPATTQAPYILTHSRATEEAKARTDKVDIIWNANAVAMLQDFLPQMLTGFSPTDIAKKIKDFS